MQVRTIIVVGCSWLLACSGSNQTSSPSDDTTSGRDAAGIDTDASSSDGHAHDLAPHAETGAAVDAPTHCKRLAEALCTRLDGCADHLLKANWGSVDTCERRLEAFCAVQFAAGQVPQSPDACLQSVRSTSCAQVLGDVMAPIPACQPTPGALAAGSACSSDAQCGSGICLGDQATSACGRCVAAPGRGEPCAGRRCAAGLECHRLVCAEPRLEGATCRETGDCGDALVCVEGTCRAAPDVEGAPCGESITGCNVFQGLFCLGTEATGRRCTRPTYAQLGERCGLRLDAYVSCERGYCQGTTSGGVLEGTCVPFAPDGAACGSGMAPCFEPAECIDGTCKLRGPRTCP